jgi:hypothetical protein
MTAYRDWLQFLFLQGIRSLLSNRNNNVCISAAVRKSLLANLKQISLKGPDIFLL